MKHLYMKYSCYGLKLTAGLRDRISHTGSCSNSVTDMAIQTDGRTDRQTDREAECCENSQDDGRAPACIKRAAECHNMHKLCLTAFYMLYALCVTFTLTL